MKVLGSLQTETPRLFWAIMAIISNNDPIDANQFMLGRILQGWRSDTSRPATRLATALEYWGDDVYYDRNGSTENLIDDLKEVVSYTDPARFELRGGLFVTRSEAPLQVDFGEFLARRCTVRDLSTEFNRQLAITDEFWGDVLHIVVGFLASQDPDQILTADDIRPFAFLSPFEGRGARFSTRYIYTSDHVLFEISGSGAG